MYWNGSGWKAYPNDQTLSYNSSNGNLTLSSGNTVTIPPASSSTGPFYITPATIYTSAGATSTNVNVFNSGVPSTAKAVILEAEAAISGPDGGDIDAHVRVAMDSGSPRMILLRGRSAGDGDNISLANQGTYPIRSDGNLFLITETPGFGSMSVRIVGYY